MFKNLLRTKEDKILLENKAREYNERCPICNSEAEEWKPGNGFGTTCNRNMSVGLFKSKTVTCQTFTCSNSECNCDYEVCI